MNATYTEWKVDSLGRWREKLSGFTCDVGDFCEQCGECLYCHGDIGWDGHLCRVIQYEYH